MRRLPLLLPSLCYSYIHAIVIEIQICRAAETSQCCRVTASDQAGNNSVTCEANYVKCNTLMQGSLPHESPKHSSNRSRGSPLRGEYLPKGGNFWYFCGRVVTAEPRLTWNFAQTSESPCPSEMLNFTLIGATSHPCGTSENVDFQPMTKFYTGSFVASRQILPVKKKNIQTPYFRTYSRRP